MYIFLAFLCLQSITPEATAHIPDLINRADLSNPHIYFNSVNQQIQTNIHQLRTAQPEQNKSITRSPKAFSYKASDFPAAVQLTSVIDAIIKKYRIELDEIEHYGLSEKHITQTERGLRERGLTDEEIQFFISVAETERQHSIGLHPVVGEYFKEKLNASGIDQKEIQKALTNSPKSPELLDRYYQIYFENYAKIQQQVYADFLSTFSLRSRKALLSYGYEKCLDGLTIYQPNEELTADNWKNLYTSNDQSKGASQ